MISRKPRKPMPRTIGPSCRCESLEDRRLFSALVNFSMLVDGGSNDGASSLQVTPGEVVNYKIMAQMAPVGTANASIPYKFTGLTPGKDGLSIASFNIQESAAAAIQANFLDTPTLQGGFGASFSSPGALTPRASTGNDDVDAVAAVQMIGKFVGVPSANTTAAVEVASGSFTVQSVGSGGASVIGMNINAPVISPGLIKIDGGQTIDVNTGETDPIFSFAGLTLTSAAVTTPPTAKLAAANLTTAGSSTYSFTVTYSGANAINVSTLGTGDIHVIGPNSFSQMATFVSASSSTNGSPITATYQLNAPSSTWTPSNNGTYSAWMETSQVADVSGKFVAAGELGTFTVNVPTVVNTPPVAKLSAAPLNTANQATYSFTVTYSGANAINVSTLGTGDIHVIGPNSFSQMATFVSASSSTNGSPITATYQLTAPSTTWAPSNNGTYSAWMETNQVADVKGNPVAAGELGTFSVSVPTTVVNTPPVAKLSAATLNIANQATYTFTVTYSGANAINVSTLGTGDIHVIGPNSFSQMATFVSASSSTNGSPITATYKLTAPSTTWAPSNNGTYSVWMETNQVADVKGNPVAAGELGTFSVSVPTMVNTPPTAKLSASALTAVNTKTYTFTVTYTGASAINVSTLGTGDIHVIGPNSFSQIATFVSASSKTNGSPITATYTLTAPSSTWTPSNNGTYSAWMETGQVTDINGIGVVAAELGTFSVDVA